MVHLLTESTSAFASSWLIWNGLSATDVFALQHGKQQDIAELALWSYWHNIPAHSYHCCDSVLFTMDVLRTLHKIIACSLFLLTEHIYLTYSLQSVNTTPISTHQLIVPASAAAEMINCFHSLCSFSMMLRANAYRHHSHYTCIHYHQILDNRHGSSVKQKIRMFQLAIPIVSLNN